MPSHVHQVDYDRLENELATIRAENAELKAEVEAQKIKRANYMHAAVDWQRKCEAVEVELERLREAVEKATARLVCAYMMDEAELRESVAEEYDTLEAALKEPGDGRRKNHG